MVRCVTHHSPGARRASSCGSRSRNAPPSTGPRFLSLRSYGKTCTTISRSGMKPTSRNVSQSSGIPCEGSVARSEEHTSELQSQSNLVCRLLLEKKKIEHLELNTTTTRHTHTLAISVSPHTRQ